MATDVNLLYPLEWKCGLETATRVAKDTKVGAKGVKWPFWVDCPFNHFGPWSGWEQTDQRRSSMNTPNMLLSLVFVAVRKTKHRSIVQPNPVTQLSTTFRKRRGTLFFYPEAALLLCSTTSPQQTATAFSLLWRLNSPASVADTATYSPPHSQCRHMNCTSPLQPPARWG